MRDSKLSEAQWKALESAVRTGHPTSHLKGMSDWGGWGSTRNALQRKGYLDSSCRITPAGRAAIGAPDE